MIVASLPTIPERKGSLLQVLRRILCEQTQQVDQLHVWLNGYPEVPSDLPMDVRLHYHLHPANPGPWIRYEVTNLVNADDIIVTIDDDLIYPEDFIEMGLRALYAMDHQVSVSFGGVFWDWVVPIEELCYSLHKRLIDYTSFLAIDTFVPVLLGGASFHRASAIKGCIAREPRGFATNDDLMVSYHLQRHRRRIVSVAKADQWIRVTEAQHASHALWRRDRGTREETFRRLIQDMGFNPFRDARNSGDVQAVLYVKDREISEAESNQLVAEFSEDLHTLEILSKKSEAIVSRPLRNHHEHFVHLTDATGRFGSLRLVRRWREKRVARWNEHRIFQYLDWIHRATHGTKMIISVTDKAIRDIVESWAMRSGCEIVDPGEGIDA